MATLKEVFDRYLSHVKFNSSLAQKFYRMQIGFVNKNDEHMAFFGGNLTGVQVVRFGEREYNQFYDEILDVDAMMLKEAIKDVEAVVQEHKISSDTFSLLTMYVIHRFLTSPSLDDKSRERAALDVALVYNYRTIANVITGYFRYPADPKLAQATYENLSYRFLIKRLGTWQEVLAFRSAEMIGGESIHRDTYIKFNNDFGIIYTITDSRGRITDMIKNIYSEMMKANRNGEKIHTTSGTMLDVDGVEIVKDKIHGLEIYTSYIMSIIPDRNSFVKNELVDIVVKMMPTMQERGFLQTLEWMSEHIHHNDQKDIEELIKLIMVHSYNYLINHGYVLKNNKDISGLLGRLRGVYVSSRSSDEDLLKLRDIGTRVVHGATKKTNEQSVAAIRTGLFLYVSLRAYTKRYYSSH